MRVSVQPNPTESEFKEGDIVCLKSDPTAVYLVSCVAQKYEDAQEGTFWGIDLAGVRVSDGNLRKDLFQRFSGKIVIEG